MAGAMTTHERLPVRMARRLSPLSAGAGRSCMQERAHREAKRCGFFTQTLDLPPTRWSELWKRSATQRSLPEIFASVSMGQDRKSTRLNSSHITISYAVFCLKKKK